MPPSPLNDREARYSVPGIGDAIIETDIPVRLDRLPWSRFHTLVVVALGITWVLDGLEVSLAGTLAGAIKTSLQLTNAQIGLANSAYLVGAVCGSLYFGRRADRLGRKRLFFVTLSVYMIFTAMTGLSWNLISLSLFRLVTGAGIGGEYAAINSAIQELIPARYRGRTDLAINGSFWLGALLGAGSSLIFLRLGPSAWRLAFFIGALLASFIFLLRQWIPESPRWLMTHRRPEEGAAIVKAIEHSIRERGGTIESDAILPWRFYVRPDTSLREAALTLFRSYPRRTAVAISLMAAQAFFFNAIFFTYPLVLNDFFHVRADQAGWYIMPFALGNLCGPLLLGRLFDSVGRKPMIVLTYALSGLLLASGGALFAMGAITALWQTIAWTIVFFFASAAASAAYLTVGEIFPLEIRALAIAVFFAIGTGVGGAFTPWLFGALIGTGSRTIVYLGYLCGAGLMLGAAIMQWRWGVASERKSLESIARPLTFAD